MKKYKQELPKIAKIMGFDLPQEIKDIQCKDRTNRNKIEIRNYNIKDSLYK